jgi:hypothetical protein
MYVFNITPTEKSKIWIEEHKINVFALNSALSMLISEIQPTNKVHNIKLTLQILFNTDESMYKFKTNKICVCSTPYLPGDTLSTKQTSFFDHFLHEFRHWMQSQLYKIGSRHISYTDEDVHNNKNAYYRNKLEIDARRFVRTNIKKFEKYYRLFSKM